jgi:hypothetical protein
MMKLMTLTVMIAAANGSTPGSRVTIVAPQRRGTSRLRRGHQCEIYPDDEGGLAADQQSLHCA